MNTRIIFVRHGEAEGNLKRLFHGWTDSELTSKGHLQAQLVSERLKDESIDVIYSSPLKRAYQTAQYIAKAKNISEVIINDNLKEIHGGLWENEKWENLTQKWPKEYEAWENSPHMCSIPMGETMKEAFDRALKAVLEIVGQNQGKNICIVLHGTILRTLLCYFYGKSFEELVTMSWHDNTSVTIVEFDSNSYKVILEGDNSHLSEEASTFASQDWWKKE